VLGKFKSDPPLRVVIHGTAVAGGDSSREIPKDLLEECNPSRGRQTLTSAA
jgi:hypothetical protein